eukprot:14530554-Alexandrium_andersonii.AAC.1
MNAVRGRSCVHRHICIGHIARARWAHCAAGTGPAQYECIDRSGTIAFIDPDDRSERLHSLTDHSPFAVAAAAQFDIQDARSAL